MNHTVPGAERFDLDAGTLCLDFVNTLDDRYDEQPVDLLHGYDDLLAFASAADAIDVAERAMLTNLASAAPDADAVHAAALVLREALFRIFATLAAGESPGQSDLDELTIWIGRVGRHGLLHVDGDHVSWSWEALDPDDPRSLDRPLWPVVHDAAELLLHGDIGRVRECAADDCGWLFIDTSRNRSRRWCSMQTCGNRAKVSHFRDRQRA